MTKIFQTIIRLLRRHLLLLSIYRRYLKRFGRRHHHHCSTENLCSCSSNTDNNSEEDLILLNRRTVKRYHSAGEIDRDWYGSQEVVSHEADSMPCDILDNWARYEEEVDNRAAVRRTRLLGGGRSPAESNDNGRGSPGTSSVARADFSVERMLGSGGFGSVFLGRYRGRRVAVKSLRQPAKNREASRQSFRAELNALSLRHENVVGVLATTALEDFDAGAFVIMEYAGRRNLQQVINDPARPLPPARRLHYALHIIRALQYTHSMGIAHLDVKPANVIVDGDTDVCRLGDFGCSQRLADEEDSVTFSSRSYLTGTFAYRAPELLRGRAPTAKADIYSYGVTLWQMLTREAPFAGENHHVVVFGVVAHNLRPCLPAANANDAWYERLVGRCWDGSTERRPSAADILASLESRTNAGDYLT